MNANDFTPAQLRTLEEIRSTDGARAYNARARWMLIVLRDAGLITLESESWLDSSKGHLRTRYFATAVQS